MKDFRKRKGVLNVAHVQQRSAGGRKPTSKRRQTTSSQSFERSPGRQVSTRVSQRPCGYRADIALISGKPTIFNRQSGVFFVARHFHRSKRSG